MSAHLPEVFMAKVILICGKICSGKSTYAQSLRRQQCAVLLSVDEIMLSLFGQHVGDMHDAYAARTREYLFNKSLEILETGVPVILDWGFWNQEDRMFARQFYQSHRIPCEFHYIDVSDETWHTRLRKRNQDILDGKTRAYYVDENLSAKVDALFQVPGRDEIDVWIVQ